MISDLSDSVRNDDPLPVFKRRMIWSSPSNDSEASTQGSNNIQLRDSDVESLPRGQENPNRFVPREDTTANVARELDLPEESDEMLRRKNCRQPALCKAGGSSWQEMLELPILLKVKDEEVYYNPKEAAKLLQLAFQTQAAKAEKGGEPEQSGEETRSTWFHFEH